MLLSQDDVDPDIVKWLHPLAPQGLTCKGCHYCSTVSIQKWYDRIQRNNNLVMKPTGSEYTGLPRKLGRNSKQQGKCYQTKKRKENRPQGWLSGSSVFAEHHNKRRGFKADQAMKLSKAVIILFLLSSHTCVDTPRGPGIQVSETQILSLAWRGRAGERSCSQWIFTTSSIN